MFCGAFLPLVNKHSHPAPAARSKKMKLKKLRYAVSHFQKSKFFESLRSTLLSRRLQSLTAITLGLLLTPNCAKAEQALPTSYSQVFYVSPTGNDNNPGTAAQPFLTITAAANNPNITPGSCVCVEDGTYNEIVYLNTGGNANSP